MFIYQTIINKLKDLYDTYMLMLQIVIKDFRLQHTIAKEIKSNSIKKNFIKC